MMLGVSSSGLTTRDRRVLTQGQVGSVIFLGNSRAGLASVRRLTSRVRLVTPRPHRIATMLTVDQEGGTVQRLRGPGFSTIPSAVRQARMTNTQLAARARTWGTQLRAAGIDADLAPVADVVPAALTSVNQPIGMLRRGYGSSPHVVALKAGAFTRGMERAGVATSVKHFPGLGRVRGNTDFTTRVTDHTTTRHDAALQGFAGAVEAQVDMVMVSTAYYARIDPARRAAFSPVVINQMIRHDLGFNGVVISDDLSAAAVRDLTPSQRALRFLRAGGDLMIVGNPVSAPSMLSAVATEATRSPAFSSTVKAKAARVLAMKARHGLARCS